MLDFVRFSFLNKISLSFRLNNLLSYDIFCTYFLFLMSRSIFRCIILRKILSVNGIKTYIVLVVFGRTDPGAQKASPPKDPSALVLQGAAEAGLHGNLPHNGPDPRARLSAAVSVLGQDSKRRTKAPLASNPGPGNP